MPDECRVDDRQSRQEDQRISVEFVARRQEVDADAEQTQRAVVVEYDIVGLRWDADRGDNLVILEKRLGDGDTDEAD